MANDAEDLIDVTPAVLSTTLELPVRIESRGDLDRPIGVQIREARLVGDTPWVRCLGALPMKVSTKGWRFPSPVDLHQSVERASPTDVWKCDSRPIAHPPFSAKRTSLRPPGDAVQIKDRLFCLLQPPLENVLFGKQVRLESAPYPYQLEGIAFLMPRHAALLADEMGLGKTMQAILAVRLALQAGMVKRALIVCPKALVHNWCREIRQWGEDMPFEVIAGDAEMRHAAWLVSPCPVKLVNYELLTRDAALLDDDRLGFDLVILDEAQRIKNRHSKTSQAACSLRRERSWALTGTPIENRADDFASLFSFIDPGRVPFDTPPRRMAELTRDCTLRRTKDDVLTDLPARTIKNTYLELTAAQRRAYERAERDGVVRLNALGDTITVQHVFELVLRLKQICNFDPCSGESAKLEQLECELAEVCDSGRKAIVFSQWVQPLQRLRQALSVHGPFEFHGRVSPQDRSRALDRFRTDPTKHVLLMSYGAGSVGLNLQCANYVFLFDRWWNPAVEDQAINRAHRIGQQNPVFVTRFISENTIEERIAEILDKKRAMFEELIEDSAPPPPMGLTEDEILGLFDIQARPKRIAA